MNRQELFHGEPHLSYRKPCKQGYRCASIQGNIPFTFPNSYLLFTVN
jgi:hypothetical protein